MKRTFKVAGWTITTYKDGAATACDDIDDPTVTVHLDDGHLCFDAHDDPTVPIAVIVELLSVSGYRVTAQKGDR